MSTIADLPISARLLTGPENAWNGTIDGPDWEDNLTWAVPWRDSNAFYAAVVGQTVSISFGSSGASISRKIPLQHPFNPNLWAKKISYRGIDGPCKPRGAVAAVVKLGITFGYLPYNLGGNLGDAQSPTGVQQSFPPFVRIAGKSAQRAVTDPSRKYTYGPDSNHTTPLNQAVGRQFGGNSYSYTLYCIPDLAAWEALVIPLCGTTNSLPLVVGSTSRSAGTVLFEGYGFELDADAAGNARWTGTVDLHCSSLPWNSVFAGGAVSNLYPPPFPTADHNVMYL